MSEINDEFLFCPWTNILFSFSRTRRLWTQTHRYNQNRIHPLPERNSWRTLVLTVFTTDWDARKTEFVRRILRNDLRDDSYHFWRDVVLLVYSFSRWSEYGYSYHRDVIPDPSLHVKIEMCNNIYRQTRTYQELLCTLHDQSWRLKERRQTYQNHFPLKTLILFISMICTSCNNLSKDVSEHSSLHHYYQISVNLSKSLVAYTLKDSILTVLLMCIVIHNDRIQELLVMFLYWHLDRTKLLSLSDNDAHEATGLIFSITTDTV